jgi:hypothetical protein
LRLVEVEDELLVIREQSKAINSPWSMLAELNHREMIYTHVSARNSCWVKLSPVDVGAAAVVVAAADDVEAEAAVGAARTAALWAKIARAAEVKSILRVGVVLITEKSVCKLARRVYMQRERERRKRPKEM